MHTHRWPWGASFLATERTKTHTHTHTCILHTHRDGNAYARTFVRSLSAALAASLSSLTRVISLSLALITLSRCETRALREASSSLRARICRHKTRHQHQRRKTRRHHTGVRLCGHHGLHKSADTTKTIHVNGWSVFMRHFQRCM